METTDKPMNPTPEAAQAAEADEPVTFAPLEDPKRESEPVDSAPAFLSGVRRSFWPDNFNN